MLTLTTEEKRELICKAHNELCAALGYLDKSSGDNPPDIIAKARKAAFSALDAIHILVKGL